VVSIESIPFEREIGLEALEVRRPSLEDVYLELTSTEEAGGE